jgi:TPP-dependent pyruvate/acetoin dehydrogenase alpha subunit
MSAAKGLSREQLLAFLAEMLLIRRFEEKVTERFRAGELAGFLHAAIGQEAVAVGVCRALEDGDLIASTHRAHGHVIANGTPQDEVMAELYGKLEGCSHGYGGSMHLYDVERNPQIYRDREKLRELREKRDPIERLRLGLKLSEEEWAGPDGEAQHVVDAAVEFAQASTDPSPTDALKNVYAP